MPLDTASKEFMNLLSSFGGPPLWELPIGAARTAVNGLSTQLCGPLTDVHEVINRKISGPTGEFGIRLYTPKASRELLPIVLHYHGGGWALCNLDTHDAIARFYCKHADAIVVSVDYRLAPEHKFPAAVDDSFAAFCWAVDHAGEFGGDPKRVAVTGDSAGGTLSTVVCQLAKSKGGPKIAFQALLYPAVDLDLKADYASRKQFDGPEYFLSLAEMEWFGSLYFNAPEQDVKDPRASPLLSPDLAGLPPALIVTAGCDALLDEGKAYADKLKSAGVPVEYRCFEGTIHAFVSFSGAIPKGSEAMALVASRLRQALHPS
jgi:acetyl esterase